MAKRPVNLNRKTVDLIEKSGFLCDVVERSNRAISQDYLGFIDVIAVGPYGKFLGLQVTSHSNRSSRKNKILECVQRSQDLVKWLEYGCQFEIWGWRTGKKHGCKTFSVMRARSDKDEGLVIEVVEKSLWFQGDDDV
jgi:hypothetical protein